MKYAAFHPEYSDVAPHFNEMGRMLGLYRDEGSDGAEEASGDSLGDTPSRRGVNAGVGEVKGCLTFEGTWEGWQSGSMHRS